MDLNTVVEVRDARERRPWAPGDAWLAGGTQLFSEPRPHLRGLVDLSRTGWTPVRFHRDGAVEIAATCTIAELARFDCPVSELVVQCSRAFLASFKVWNTATVGGNLCTALPAGPMISLTAALDGTCLLVAQDGSERRIAVRDFVTGPGEHVLAEGELLRSITLPASALVRRTAFRQASLHGLGRSAVLVVGTAGADFAVTITASTTRPFHLVFAGTPTAEELRAEIDRVATWFDDVHGLPAWRRHMTLRLAEEIRLELAGAR